MDVESKRVKLLSGILPVEVGAGHDEGFFREHKRVVAAAVHLNFKAIL